MNNNQKNKVVVVYENGIIKIFGDINKIDLKVFDCDNKSLHVDDLIKIDNELKEIEEELDQIY